MPDHPLELIQDEINFPTTAAHEASLKTAITKYELSPKNALRNKKLFSPRNFKDLSSVQQTASMSNGYQYGSPKDSLIAAIISNDRKLIPAVRERNYLFQAMPDPTKK